MKLLEGHHLDVGGVNQPLELGRLNVPGVSYEVGQPQELVRHEVRLWDALQLAEEGSVAQETDVLGVEGVLEESSLPRPQLDSQPLECSLELGLWELAIVVPVE